jgi:ATP-dependent protease ClpP protease subunit
MAKISIRGTIVADDDKWIYDWFGIRTTCPMDVQKELEKANGEDLEVEISSGGGDVIAGNEIYTLLRMYKGNVTNIIVGMAASAASYIASSRRCIMTPVGFYMIHNASGYASGDYRVMDKESEILQTVNKAITAAYMEKTSMSQKELLKLMDEETWLTAEEAVNYGFVDAIIENQEYMTQANQKIGFSNAKNLIALYDGTQILGRETIEKTREMLAKSLVNIKNTTPDADVPTRAEGVLSNKNKKVEVEEMADTNSITTIEDLTAAYPALAQQIKDLAATTATSAENERMKAIDAIAGQIPDKMVADAKNEEKKLTAESLALEALKCNNVIAKDALTALKADIEESGAKAVEVTANVGFADDSGIDKETEIKNLANKFKRK